MDTYEMAVVVAQARFDKANERSPINHAEAWLRKVTNTLMNEEHDRPGQIAGEYARITARERPSVDRRNLTQEAASLIHHMRKQGVHTEADIIDVLGDEYESVRTAAFRIVDGDYRIVGPHGEDLEP
jgi:hypothetical protein